MSFHTLHNVGLSHDPINTINMVEGWAKRQYTQYQAKLLTRTDSSKFSLVMIRFIIFDHWSCFPSSKHYADVTDGQKKTVELLYCHIITYIVAAKNIVIYF